MQLLAIENYEDPKPGFIKTNFDKVLYVCDDSSKTITAYLLKAKIEYDFLDIYYDNYSTDEEDIGCQENSRRISSLFLDDANMILGQCPEIGKVEATGEGELEHIKVSPSFRHHGIGTNLITFAIEQDLISKIICIKKTDDENLSLTPAGERLIAHCVKAGIVTRGMCDFDGEYPSEVVSMTFTSANLSDEEGEEESYYGCACSHTIVKQARAA